MKTRLVNIDCAILAGSSYYTLGMFRGFPNLPVFPIGRLFGFAFIFRFCVSCSSFLKLDDASAFCSVSDAFGVFLRELCKVCVFLENWESYSEGGETVIR